MVLFGSESKGEKYRNEAFLCMNSGKVEKAYSKFVKAAACGDLEAKYQMGLCLVQGLGVEKNVNRGLEIIRECAISRLPEPEHPRAQFYMARKYYPELFDYDDEFPLIDILFDGDTRGAKYRTGAQKLLHFSKKTVTAAEMASWHLSCNDPCSSYAQGFALLAANKLQDSEQFEAISGSFLISAIGSKGALPEGKFAYGYLCWHIEGDREEGINWMKQAAEAGIRPAIREYASMLLDSSSDEQRMACKTLDALSLEGDSRAGYSLGMHYHKQGRYYEAFRVLSRIVGGSMYPDAKLHVAEMLEHGRGTGEDTQKARHLYQILADDGSLDDSLRHSALVGLARIDSSAYSETDPKKTYANLVEAEKIRPNNAETLCLLGLWHYRHRAWNSENKCVALFWRSARLGWAEAYYRLGWIYRRGSCGVERDAARALSMLKEAANLGHLEAQELLGLRFSEGIDVERDATRGRYWLEKAVSGGSSSAVLHLADLAFEEKAYTEARERYESAAANSYALYRLGVIYENGLGVPRDCKKAAAFYQKGYQADSSAAKLKWADCLFEGKGVRPNRKEAVRLYQEITTLPEVVRAKSMLGHCSELGIELEKDAVAAIEHYEKAIEAAIAYDSNDSLPKRLLASCYERGVGVDRNINQAESLYREAAAGGDEEAIRWIAERAKAAESELDEMVGLSAVKEAVEALKRELEYENTLRAAGVTPAAPKKNRHMLFLGNPGTGKTTVARIVAELLFRLGVTKSSTLVEVDRGDLVGEHWGAGPKNAKRFAEEASGGVLFIDEAYSLKKSSTDGLGGETIDALVKIMEDERDQLVVIMAGYEKEMEEFLKSNSGLRSRFHYTFTFDDYSLDELMEIFLSTVDRRGYSIEAGAVDLVREDFRQASRADDFGNGRYVEGYFQRLVEQHMMTSYNSAFPETFVRLTKSDVIASRQDRSTGSETECGDSLHSSLAYLNAMIGLENVKTEIRRRINSIRVNKREEEAGYPAVRMHHHIALVGNPGTGKTAVARLYGKMLGAVGIGGAGFRQVSAKDLIAGYLGQTALKTASECENAYGGVLFIDEAHALYSASENQFEKEALSELIQQMENNADRLVVILAGYTDEMNTLFDKGDPGLKSRIGMILQFDDYETDELLKIAEKFFIEEWGGELTNASRDKLRQVVHRMKRSAGSNFGNAREMRNLYEQTIIRRADRLAESDVFELGRVILPEDIPDGCGIDGN